MPFPPSPHSYFPPRPLCSMVRLISIHYVVCRFADMRLCCLPRSASLCRCADLRLAVSSSGIGSLLLFLRSVRFRLLTIASNCFQMFSVRHRASACFAVTSPHFAGHFTGSEVTEVTEVNFNDASTSLQRGQVYGKGVVRKKIARRGFAHKGWIGCAYLNWNGEGEQAER